MISTPPTSRYIEPSPDPTDSFIRLTNSDGKAWIVPTRGMKRGLSLYQPSGVRGRLLKSLLPYLHPLPQVVSMIEGERMQIRLCAPLERVIRRTLGLEQVSRRELQFSIFEGTPSIHQKVTIQIFCADKILAYCKLSDNAEVTTLFRREQQRLEELHRCGVDNIPRCLYCGEVEGDPLTTLFVQSTIKSRRSTTLHRWSREHRQFIEQLHRLTAVRLPFAESDFAKSLARLEHYLPTLSPQEQSTIRRATNQVREYYGDGEVLFSAYHADFTPWNTLLERGQLYVFDFEYAAMSYPPRLDYFHFATQTSQLVKHLPARRIVEEVARETTLHHPTSYRSYLLDTISRYIDRESGCISPATRASLSLWIELLRTL